MLTFKEFLIEDPDYSLGLGAPGLHRMEHKRRLSKDVYHPTRHRDAVNRLLNDRSMTNSDLDDIHTSITGTKLPAKSSRRAYGVSLLAHGAEARRKRDGSI